MREEGQGGILNPHHLSCMGAEYIRSMTGGKKQFRRRSRGKIKDKKDL